MNEEVMQFIGKALINDVSEIEYLRKEVNQLTNNWNELEEYIENESSKYIPTDPYIDGTNATYEEVLGKMKEIKGGNYENK